MRNKKKNVIIIHKFTSFSLIQMIHKTTSDVQLRLGVRLLCLLHDTGTGKAIFNHVRHCNFSCGYFIAMPFLSIMCNTLLPHPCHEDIH